VVEQIFISREHGGRLVECMHVELELAMGIVGDRNFGRNTYPGQNITLVEAEEVERFCREHGRTIDLSITRRNLVTRGIRLNSLVGKEFTIGTVRLIGVELCEPCSALGNSLANESLAVEAVIRAWVGRGGLRADIISGGKIDRGARLQIGP
jgi:MOSC domain-containing protein YiiM